MQDQHRITPRLRQRRTRRGRDRVGAVNVQLSAETLRLYARAWACFARFCAEHGRAVMPASPEMVSAVLV